MPGRFIHCHKVGRRNNSHHGKGWCASRQPAAHPASGRQVGARVNDRDIGVRTLGRARVVQRCALHRLRERLQLRQSRFKIGFIGKK